MSDAVSATNWFFFLIIVDSVAYNTGWFQISHYISKQPWNLNICTFLLPVASDMLNADFHNHLHSIKLPLHFNCDAVLIKFCKTGMNPNLHTSNYCMQD